MVLCGCRFPLQLARPTQCHGCPRAVIPSLSAQTGVLTAFPHSPQAMHHAVHEAACRTSVQAVMHCAAYFLSLEFHPLQKFNFLATFSAAKDLRCGWTSAGSRDLRALLEPQRGGQGPGSFPHTSGLVELPHTTTQLPHLARAWAGNGAGSAKCCSGYLFSLSEDGPGWNHQIHFHLQQKSRPEPTSSQRATAHNGCIVQPLLLRN